MEFIGKFCLHHWPTYQPASIKFTGESTIDSSMLYPLLLMIAAFYALFTCCLLLNMRTEILRREARTRWVKQLAGDTEGS